MKKIVEEYFEFCNKYYAHPITIEFKKTVRGNLGCIDALIMQNGNVLQDYNIHSYGLIDFYDRSPSDKLIDEYNEWVPSEKTYQTIIERVMAYMVRCVANQTMKFVEPCSHPLANIFKDELMGNKSFTDNLLKQIDNNKTNGNESIKEQDHS